jgi:hypothetical protein
MNQMKRWYSGGWQNLKKHRNIAIDKPNNALELTMMYTEGLAFSSMIFILPIINLPFFIAFIFSYMFIVGFFALYSTLVRKRIDLMCYYPTYLVLVFLNAYMLLDSFFKEMVFNQKTNIWFKPNRRVM